MDINGTKIIYPSLFLVSILLSACGGGGGGTAMGTTSVRYAYVANYGADNVSQYAIAANGALSLKTTVAAGIYPKSVTVDAAGKYAYVANSLDFVISQYKIVGGVLMQMSPATEPSGDIAGSGPISFTLEPSGKFAYAANSGSDSVTQFSIDATTGALTNLVTVAAGTSPAFVTVTTDPSGNKYAYVLNTGFPCPIPPNGCSAINPSISQYSIDAMTGVLTPMATVTLALGTDPASITVDPTGKYAYVANYGNNTISQYDIGKVTPGVLTPMSPTPTVGSGTLLSLPTSIAIDPTGTHAYVANGSGVYQYAITNGALVDLPTPTIITGGFGQRAISVDGSGNFVYVANQSSDSISQFSIDTGGQLSALVPNYVTSAANSQPFSITTAVSIQ